MGERGKKVSVTYFLFGHSMGAYCHSYDARNEERRCRWHYFKFAMFRRISWTFCTASSCLKNIKYYRLKLQFATNLTVEMSTRNHEVRDAMENDSLFLRKSISTLV